MMNSNQVKYGIGIFAVTCMLIGCSSVRVMKVSGTSELEGIPFYLPRPYVQVFEPFVIGSSAYIVSGKLSPDGQYLLIDNMKDQTQLGGLFQSDISKEQAPKVPVSIVRRSPANKSTFGVGPQGGTEKPAEPAKAPSDNVHGVPTSEPKAPESDGAREVGNFNISVTNTTSLFPPTLGRRFFDVVWMPDFDEKYIVQGTPGLGNSNIAVTMTQGWGLYGLDARVDNSALIKPLLNFYSTSLDALGKLAHSKIIPAGDLAGGGPQGALESAAIPPGARVSIKVTKVQVVAPGLYPILKPNETLNQGDNAIDTSKLVKRHLPLRPYTNIAFNTYEVVVVEAAKAVGDTPMNLQRYFDSDGQTGAITVPPGKVPGEQSPFDVKVFENHINGLLANRKGPNGEFWKLSSLSVDGSNLKGTATLTGGTQKPSALTTIEQLRTFVASQSKGKFTAANVNLDESK